MKIVALAGGVGGAKLIDGFAKNLSPLDLTIIVNTGDDFNHLGMRICPDLDTICYTLAGMANPDTGWGRENECWTVLAGIKQLGGPDWFRIGDKDLATHLERSRRLMVGQPLSRIIQDFCKSWNINQKVLPMSDQKVSTIITTLEYGEISFQDYFVRNKCAPTVKRIHFEGIKDATPTPGLIDAIEQADAIVICPSNPWVSIDPILSISGIRTSIIKKPTIAVSPIINGKAIKGPAAKMYSELGIQPSALAVANHYKTIISAIVIDNQDSALSEAISHLGIIPFECNILMKLTEDRVQVSQDVLNYIERILNL
ncbi:MAG: 2-phospho-L-lactate transferase [Chloroflexi bacterium GWB2_49_20]|nr:MAG: 2-phospho-L-lactate transferase [Chloroflexi bacterium GWB2_49_20]OGN78896.1 MAG: 2-phospho-L-lactate transferase [Chloroflexi bacterium GWC2_49_37]OGN86343.1 MAG: 2-phospho-L-lactate transferase [Chloroflexi bacterium GWD2_49_16]HBG74575.1 2-phospho-L-lactate transferase [Anaerolineae bacterium]